MIPAVTGATGQGIPAVLSYLWVVAGSNGELYTSTSTTLANGSWTSRTSSFGADTILGVASNGTNLYVAVGGNGKLATSPDGITWTQQTSSFGTDNIQSVAYGNGYWVATGNAAKVAYSTDGVTWTQKTTGISGTVSKVAWGNGVWVIGNSTGSFYTATDPTSTWTARTSTLGATSDILYFKGQSIWVAGSDTGTTGALASSTDGLTWTARTSAISVNSTNVKFAANTTVVTALTPDGSLTVDIQSSTNGTSWTNRTPALTSSLAYWGMSDDAGLMVFNGFQTSTDGTTWSSRTQPSSNVTCGTHSTGTPSLR
jgi:hypothetical protein